MLSGSKAKNKLKKKDGLLRTSKKSSNGVVDDSFFTRKANESKKTLDRVGFPNELILKK